MVGSDQVDQTVDRWERGIMGTHIQASGFKDLRTITPGGGTMRCIALSILTASCVSSPASDAPGQVASAVAVDDEAQTSLSEFGQYAENADQGSFSTFRPAQVAQDSANVARVREARGRMVPAPSEAARSRDVITSTESLRALASVESSPAVMNFHITIEEEAFDFKNLNTRDDSVRQARINDRAEQIRPSQDRMERGIVALGGRVVGRLWLANQLMVEAPRSAVAAILDLPGVTGGYEEATVRHGVAYNGSEVRAGTLATSLHNAGYFGNARSRNGVNQRIRIGIAELGRLNTAHVGFLDYGFGGPSRIARYAYCSGGTCVNQTALPFGMDNHGTWVASAALGSIEDFQDTNFLGFQTAAQMDRSGINPEASLYYYQTPTAPDFATSIQQAVADGVDIYSASWTMSCGSWWCDLAAVGTVGTAWPFSVPNRFFSCVSQDLIPSHFGRG